MDVIALHQAGFDRRGGAARHRADRGTTGELWRLSPAPVLCFDGDAAGARAAARAAELALPMLAPERTLRLPRCRRARIRTAWCATPGRAGVSGDAGWRAPAGRVSVRPAARRPGRSDAGAARGVPDRLEGRRRSSIPDKALAGEYRSVPCWTGSSRAGRRADPAARRSANQSAGQAAASAVPPRTDHPTGPASRPPPTRRRSPLNATRILTAILLRHPGCCVTWSTLMRASTSIRPGTGARCHRSGQYTPKSLTLRP
jgi:DNA primase